jgi:hypothetical protein
VNLRVKIEFRQPVVQDPTAVGILTPFGYPSL